MKTKSLMTMMAAALCATMLFHAVAQQPVAPTASAPSALPAPNTPPTPATPPAQTAPSALPAPPALPIPPRSLTPSALPPSAGAPPSRPSSRGGGISANTPKTRTAGVAGFGSGPAQTSGSVPPLIIQFTGGDPSLNMEEDMAIMTRLFERSLDQLGEIPLMSKLGIRFTVTSDKRSVRATYLEGFGAVFMVKVNFPVFAASAPVERKQAPVTDSEWERAKRELAGGSNSDSASNYEAAEGAQYDANLVARLTESLLTTLKNATNIRGLKADEGVAVAVFGPPSGPGSVTRTSNRIDGPAGDLPGATYARSTDLVANSGFLSSVAGQAAWRGTVLTLKAKRSEIEAFAKGDLTLEAFRARVPTNAYAGDGYGMTSVNSWVKEVATEPRTR
jgi:hypothetical protein